METRGGWIVSDKDGRIFNTPFNVVAGFLSKSEADTAAERLTSAGLPVGSLEVGAGPHAGGPIETAALRAEMQSELNAHWGIMTGRHVRGRLFGTGGFALAGVAIGAVIGLILGLFQSNPLAATIVTWAVIGLLAGGTLGFVAGGGATPQTGAVSAPESSFNDPRPAAERDVLIAVHATDAETAERAATMLRDDLHADRVDLVDATGTPLPPQQYHPRPADPEGYWWRHAGQG